MDASSRRILGLVSETNTRFVVPVYQRPYSWGEEQCVQLWDDVLACGRRRAASHFTGSIVTIQDGTPTGAEVSSLLLIDGQQRITTIMLLMVALARYADAHADAGLAFSHDEIVDGGYLTNRFRAGADHYKLALSKGDRAVFQALVDHVERPGVPAPTAPSRILENLALFEGRLAALRDVGSVWRGLQRLEVVSIELTQGTDDPQVIFESMNATGKDLSNADLVRNFVLMSHPIAEQRDLYATYWRPLEETLGGGSLDETFDAFLRTYLTIAYAPSVCAEGDAYRAFKRHVLLGGYHEHDRMRNFILRLRRYAGYYAAVTSDAAAGAGLRRALGRVALLDAPALNPLLVALLNARDHNALSADELLRVLGVIEGYLLRRAVCDCPASVLPTFVASLVARLDAVASEGAAYADALVAMLLNEVDTDRRFPADAEFAHALRTRDAYHLACAPYLLARLEGACGGSDDVCGLMGASVVERVLPPRALAVDEWRLALGDDPERAFETCVNNVGNLTLTPYDFELQDATFAGKLERVARGDETLAISRDVVSAASWDVRAIAARADRLTDVALRTWPLPELAEGARKMYRATGRAAHTATVTFADLFAAGLVQMDDTLVSMSALHPGRATVTSRGRIMLADGESFSDPAAAFHHLLVLLGTSADLDGWLYWRLGDGGPTLDDLRARLL